jgi:hypothetical protein
MGSSSRARVPTLLAGRGGPSFPSVGWRVRLGRSGMEGLCQVGFFRQWVVKLLSRLSQSEWLRCSVGARRYSENILPRSCGCMPASAWLSHHSYKRIKHNTDDHTYMHSSL